jgi:5'(3')-deoxyribonucleotidase
MSDLPILLDCDEVLTDFVGACLDLAAREGGVYATRDEITGWDIGKAIGWPKLNDAITFAVNNKELCARLKEVPGSIPWLRDVEATFGADRVYVCTSPWNGRWADQRIDWLAFHGVPLKRVIQMSNKKLVPGYLVDDALHHIEARPAGTGFLIAQPWNKAGEGLYPRGDHTAALAWLKEVAS